MLTFRMRFRGMCSFAIPPAAKEAWVLMRNLTQEKDLEPHQAAILIPAKYIAFKEAESPLATLFMRVFRSDVEILPGGTALSGDLNIKDFPRTGNPDLTDPSIVSKNSFLWAAPLDLACRGAGLSDEGGYADGSLISQPLKDTIAARLRLKGGSLTVTERASSKGQYIVWRFRPVKGFFCRKGYRQILASEVLFETITDYDFVDLSIKTIDSAEPLLFRLRPVDEVIDIRFVNEEAGQVVGGGRLEEIRMGKTRKQDRVFETYYSMSQAPTIPRFPIPIAKRLVGEAPAGDGGAHNAPPCSPSQMILNI